MSTLFWLSFCDATRPQGQQFLGVIITRAADHLSAIQKTHKLGINPGGEVRFCGEVCPDEGSKKYKEDVLLSKDELKELGYID